MSPSFLVRRLLFALISLLAAVTLIFLMVRLVPGNPVATLLGDYYNPEAAQVLREQLGLGLPLWQQFANFMQRLFSGDLGVSFITKQPVFGTVLASFKFTLRLAFAALLVTALLGVPLGIIAALQRNRIADLAAMTIAIIGASMPSFWLGILLMIVFAVKLGWLPLIGVGDPGELGDIVLHLVLPALTLGLRGAGLIARVTRSAMLDALSQDYIRTARSKGLRQRLVVNRHALRNALLPLITVLGLDLGRLLGGTTVTETVFSRPGTGILLIQAVLARDYPMIQATFMLFLTVIIAVNFLVDLLYASLDPRVVYT